MFWSHSICYDVINNNLWPESSYVVDAVLWSKFGRSSISTSVIITLFLKEFVQKNILRSGIGSSQIIKITKRKVKIFWGIISTLREVTGDKLVGEFPYILKRIKQKFHSYKVLLNKCSNHTMFWISLILRLNTILACIGLSFSLS